MNWATLIPWLVFGTLACLTWVIANFFWRDKHEDVFDRLKELGAREPGDPAQRANQSRLAKIVNTAAPSLSRLLQPSNSHSWQALKRSLSYAGYHSEAAAVAYLACKTACMILGSTIAGSIGLSVFGANRVSLGVTASGIAAGYLIPSFVLGFLQKRRQRRIFRALPELVDMLIICIETGQGLDNALRRLSKEFAASSPELCEEINLYNLQVQMGHPRRDALHDLGMRCGVEDLNCLTTVLIQADRIGVSIAPALRELSDGMRVKRRQLAEERAQKTAVKLIFPLVLFIFPGIFVVLVGPAAILVMRDMLSLHQ